MSQFIGIGVGPGDPELLTLKAVNHLQSLDILFVPTGKKDGKSQAENIVKNYLKPSLQIIRRHFPMQKDKETALNHIAQEIEDYVNQGQRVGFITLGDPMLYSTYIYLLKRLKNRIPIRTVVGVSAYSAIASAYNYPLVEGDSPLLIYPCIGSMDDLESKLKTHDAIVLMKVYQHFEAICDLIVKLQLDTVACIVSQYGGDEERQISPFKDRNHHSVSYFTTILINKRSSL